MPTTCECGCGNEVTIKNGRPRRFISGHNRQGKRKPLANPTCTHCHKVFAVRQHLRDRVFCSRECRDEYRRSQTGADNPRFNRVNVKCSLCQKPCQILPNELQRGRIPYCSIECGKRARSEKLRAIGKSLAKPHCWSFGKRAALARDNNACRICGFDLAVHGHHIQARAKGGSNHVSNMITLCPNHHAMAHANLLSQDELQSYISDLSTAISVPR